MAPFPFVLLIVFANFEFFYISWCQTASEQILRNPAITSPKRCVSFVVCGCLLGACRACVKLPRCETDWSGRCEAQCVAEEVRVCRGRFVRYARSIVFVCWRGNRYRKVLYMKGRW